MSAPVAGLPLLNSDSGPEKKKRVLLLDTSQTKRDLRADVMRKLGIEVDCAADVIEARCWWRADLYNLVLINVSGETDSRDKFCLDIRSATPPQRIAFFVGGPKYLSASPQGNDVHVGEIPLTSEIVSALQASEGSSQRWGILEACRRISSVRSVSEARSRALRETPRPSRWAEAIEQHSVPERVQPETLFATPIERDQPL
jgi:hypothetical protein